VSASALPIGVIVDAEPVAGKDKLSAIQVDIGDEEPVKIVTNAPNAKEGNRIVVATVGATVSPIATFPLFLHNTPRKTNRQSDSYLMLSRWARSWSRRPL
jgi:tRNA-binding EMAP/Myf-like protein